VSAFYDRYMAPTGLSTVQFSLLAAINSAPGAGMQDLSDQLVMDRTSLVRAIQPLTRDGYIEQYADPENSRKRALSLTAEGREKFAEAESYWRQAQAEFEKSVGPSSTSALRGELSALASQF
jgi:DNA-binding MarR family transcriptional regulator